VTIVCAASPADAADPQVRFQVPEPFQVGQHTYEAGVIALRTVSAFTPSTTLLEVWVNGTCLGLLTARHSASEVPPGRDEALFLRNEQGRLVMIGYQVAGTPKGSTYRFDAL